MDNAESGCDRVDVTRRESVGKIRIMIDEGRTTPVVQRDLDELAGARGDADVGPVISTLLAEVIPLDAGRKLLTRENLVFSHEIAMVFSETCPIYTARGSRMKALWPRAV